MTHWCQASTWMALTAEDSNSTAHGTPLCQGPVGMRTLRLLVAGPGGGLSEGPVSGVRAGHAGVSRRPRLPARARFASFLVGEHAGEDDVG